LKPDTNTSDRTPALAQPYPYRFVYFIYSTEDLLIPCNQKRCGTDLNGSEPMIPAQQYQLTKQMNVEAIASASLAWITQ
jgi:hypothetical protein